MNRAALPRSTATGNAGKSTLPRLQCSVHTLELGHEQDLASGLAPFQAAVRLCHVGKRKGYFSTYLQLAGGNPAEYIASAFFQTGTVGNVVGETGTRQKERPLCTEDSGIEWRYWSTSLAVEYQVSREASNN